MWCRIRDEGLDNVVYEQILCQKTFGQALNMVMAWTTQRMQHVLDTWQRTGTRRVEPDLLRHIAPMHFQNINFRGEMAFPLARYRSRLIPALSSRKRHETNGAGGQ